MPTNYDPTGCIIDGAVARTNATRVADLLSNADALLEHYPGPDEYKKFTNLDSESRIHNEDWEHWHELEDDVIELINDVLPDEYICMLHPDELGTVCIWVRVELEDAAS